jgi:epoxyqueuosine reductase QueG
MSAEEILGRIREAAALCGIPDCGTASFSGCEPLLSCRAAERLPADARTVIVCVFPYKTEETPRNISRYALVQDYHRVAGGMLEQFSERLRERFPERQFVSFVDNSPIREVDAAQRAGLGVKGLHSMLIHPVYGSWVFLGSVVTDLEVALPDHPKKGCMGCGACVRACPAGALENGRVDTARCLSAVTQQKGELTPEQQLLVRQGGLLWGCDRCSEVCPCNRDVPVTPIPAFLEETKPWLRPEDLTRAVRFRAYGFRGPGPLRRNYEILYGTDDTKNSGQ